MSRSNRPEMLIVMVLVLFGWVLAPARSAPQEAPAQEVEEAPAEKEKPAEEKPAEEKAEKEKPEPAADASGAEKKDTEKGEAETKDGEAKANADTPLRQAANVVVEQLRAAAVAVGIQDDSAAPEGAETAEAAAETKEAEPERKRKRKKRPPQPPMFRMRDGTRIAGQAAVDVLRMTTAYGALEIPIADIVHVRFSSPRDSELGDRVRALVEQLGSDEFDLREEASEGLRAIGVPALESLREATRSEDQEVKTRAEKLVAELEEELEELEEDQSPYLVELQGEEDEVVTLKFTAVGRVDVSHFSVKTPYGELQLQRYDILSVVFRPPPFQRHSFQVGGAKAFAGNDKWLDTGLKLTQGASLKIAATGSLNLSNYGTNCSPDGTTGVPANGLDSFAVGALVGKIGAKGKPFLIGSEYEGTANATGNLQLGISFKSGSVRGDFEVEVEVEIEEE